MVQEIRELSERFKLAGLEEVGQVLEHILDKHRDSLPAHLSDTKILTFRFKENELPITQEALEDPRFTWPLLNSILKLTVPREKYFGLSLAPIRNAIFWDQSKHGERSLSEYMAMSDEELLNIDRLGEKSLALFRRAVDELAKRGVFVSQIPPTQ